jgi:hypothetical protein
MLFYRFLLQSPVALILQSAKQTCGDENYVKVQELGVKEDGTTPTFFSKYEVLKEYPQDMIVSTVQVVH